MNGSMYMSALFFCRPQMPAMRDIKKGQHILLLYLINIDPLYICVCISNRLMPPCSSKTLLHGKFLRKPETCTDRSGKTNCLRTQYPRASLILD